MHVHHRLNIYCHLHASAEVPAAEPSLSPTMLAQLESACSLQSQGDRVNYLMTKQAKIVAMTCTHAALKRHEFLDLAFK